MVSAADRLVGLMRPPGLEPVPTAKDLAIRGLAVETKDIDRPGTYYRIGPEGHALLGDVMRRNARRARAGMKEQPS